MGKKYVVRLYVPIAKCIPTLIAETAECLAVPDWKAQPPAAFDSSAQEGINSYSAQEGAIAKAM